MIVMSKKKIAILSLYDINNYGNRLQNYAVQEILRKYNFDTISIANQQDLNFKNKLKKYIKIILMPILTIIIPKFKLNRIRKKNFLKFNENINISKKELYTNKFNPNLLINFDFYVVGSDQVWNSIYNYPKNKIKSLYLLDFFDDNNKKISFSASFGIDKIPSCSEEQIEKYISKFKALSVREESGKKIIEKLTGRKDVIVLLDPTMLLEISEWDKVSNKPNQINELCQNGEKYILNYFLGNLNSERKREIERIANKNNCKIINILDKNDPYYTCGPSEFIWLEKNAFLICTDSFHSSVFAILYKRPFVVFNRDDGQNGKNIMNSRLETLLSKFKLEDRYYNGKIPEKLLKCNYSYVDQILEEERKKTKKFLEKALNIKK